MTRSSSRVVYLASSDVLIVCDVWASALDLDHRGRNHGAARLSGATRNGIEWSRWRRGQNGGKRLPHLPRDRRCCARDRPRLFNRSRVSGG